MIFEIVFVRLINSAYLPATHLNFKCLRTSSAIRRGAVLFGAFAAATEQLATHRSPRPRRTVNANGTGLPQAIELRDSKRAYFSGLGKISSKVPRVRRPKLLMSSIEGAGLVEVLGNMVIEFW